MPPGSLRRRRLASVALRRWRGATLLSDSASALTWVVSVRRWSCGDGRVVARSRRPSWYGWRARPGPSANWPLIRGQQRGSTLAAARAPGRRGRLADAGDVGLEVPQVGVAVAVLLAGDLAVGDLVEQLDRAVGDLRGLRARRSRPGLCSVVDVGEQLVGDRRHARRACPSCPQRLLDAVEAGPLRRRAVDVVDAGVDLGVEVAEALGDRLDRLVVGAGRGEQRLGLGDVAGLDRGGERPVVAAPAAPTLVLDVAPVRRDRRGQRRRRRCRRRRRARGGGDRERRPLGARRSGSRRRTCPARAAGVKRAGQARGEVLLLAEDPAVLAAPRPR